VAQWLGQFTGQTHETRVQDVEDSFRHAVQALHETLPGAVRERSAKTVRHLAKRVLQARLRALKARIARASEPRMTGQQTAWSDGVAALQAREVATRAGGTNAILVEFGVEELARSAGTDVASS
jgi:hypothetical protein